MSRVDFEKLLQSIDLSIKVEPLYKYRDTDIFLLRDDKINFSYGGNKVRLAIELLYDFYEKEASCILSYGSLESNFNRIMAYFCKALNIKCYILSSLSNKEYEFIYDINRKKCLNEKLTDKVGAKRYFCKKNEVRDTIATILENLKEKGEKPYYIYGDLDGKANENILTNAYFKIYNNLAKNDMDFDNIVLAYGTGMTFKGLLKAKEENIRKYKLYGISIARKEQLVDIENNNYIIDKYIGDSYGSINTEIEKLILKMDKNFSLYLDPIYTAKAFYGLLSEIELGNIKGKTLFVHSGGYPLYKDFISERKSLF